MSLLNNEELKEGWSSVPASFRMLVVLALISGPVGNIGAFTQDTQDRYRGADARKDFALRDERTADLRRDLVSFAGEVALSHTDTEKRIRELEKEVARLKRYE